MSLVQAVQNYFSSIQSRLEKLEAKLETGRTNQIRLHLWQMGFPVVGDPAYLLDHNIGHTQTLDPQSPPLQLHAWKLTFRHPLSGEEMVFETERPAWA